jgi:hypothetical protein
MRAFVVSVAICVATPAAAQMTNCTRLGNSVQCNTLPDPWARQQAQQQQLQNNMAALGTALRERKERKRQITLAAEAAKAAISEGRCSDALALALNYGDASDVQYIRQNCVSAEQAAAQAQQSWLAAVAAAVKEGRCEDAKRIALDNARLDVAEQAMRLCGPAAVAQGN